MNDTEARTETPEVGLQARVMPPAADVRHCIQYALVGFNLKFVMGTENLDDDAVRQRAHGYSWERVDRYDRCPSCEVWTRSGGKLRTNIECPAVVAALAA